jgi:hypothetical protein
MLLTVMVSGSVIVQLLHRAVSVAIVTVTPPRALVGQILAQRDIEKMQAGRCPWGSPAVLTSAAVPPAPPWPSRRHHHCPNGIE